jgi:hypothetical protein
MLLKLHSISKILAQLNTKLLKVTGSSEFEGVSDAKS